MIQFIGNKQVLLTNTCLTDGYYLSVINALILAIGNTDRDIVGDNELSLLMMLVRDLLPAESQINMDLCANNY